MIPAGSEPRLFLFERVVVSLNGCDIALCREWDRVTSDGCPLEDLACGCGCRIANARPSLPRILRSGFMNRIFEEEMRDSAIDGEINKVELSFRARSNPRVNPNPCIGGR